MYRFDFTQNYNFNQEINDRNNYCSDGIETDRVELGDGFYAAVIQTGMVNPLQSRVTVWLGHKDHEERVYAFTFLIGVNCIGLDYAVQNTIKLKFKTNYAKLIKAYTKKYCK